MEFKDIIKEVLLLSGVTQQDFAKSINTTQGTISKWLNGIQYPQYHQLRQIAIEYSIDPAFLLGLSPI